MSFSVALVKFHRLGINLYVLYQSECRNCCLYIIIQKIAPQARIWKLLPHMIPPPPDFGRGVRNDGVLSKRMQVILDSFRAPGFSPYTGREERRVQPVSRGFIFARRRLCLNIYRSAASLTCFASKNRKTELCRKQNMAERRLVPFANVIRDVTQRFSPTWERSVA